jgi:hypothetical protein
MKKHLILLVISILIFIPYGKSQDQPMYETEIFKNVAWDLALSVCIEDISNIDNILQEGKINVDVRDEKIGVTMLIFAVSRGKYKSAEALLKHGANPNLKIYNSLISPIIIAASKNQNLLKLLVDYGANPNTTNPDQYIVNSSPLFAAANTSLENVKILIKAGADIEFKDKSKRTALFFAVWHHKADIVRYLLIEKNAEFNYVFSTNKDNKKEYIVDYLRGWTYPIDSEEYKIKMEIVDYLKKNGMDYRKTTIPKQIYQRYSQKYLDKY